MVRKELTSIEIVREKFEDFVAKVSVHGPDMRFAESKKKAVPISLMCTCFLPASEHGEDVTDMSALESTKVL
jgi:hypothetical protein